METSSSNKLVAVDGQNCEALTLEPRTGATPSRTGRSVHGACSSDLRKSDIAQAVEHLTTRGRSAHT